MILSKDVKVPILLFTVPSKCLTKAWWQSGFYSFDFKLSPWRLLDIFLHPWRSDISLVSNFKSLYAFCMPPSTKNTLLTSGLEKFLLSFSWSFSPFCSLLISLEHGSYMDMGIQDLYFSPFNVFSLIFCSRQNKAPPPQKRPTQYYPKCKNTWP